MSQKIDHRPLHCTGLSSSSVNPFLLLHHPRGSFPILIPHLDFIPSAFGTIYIEMSEPAHAISIPGSAPSSSSFRLDSVVSPVSITSPTSMASPFSGSSTGSLAGGAHNMFASSIATSMSSHSAASPEDDPCGMNYLGKDVHGADLATKKSKPHKCEECGASFAR